MVHANGVVPVGTALVSNVNSDGQQMYQPVQIISVPAPYFIMPDTASVGNNTGAWPCAQEETPCAQEAMHAPVQAEQQRDVPLHWQHDQLHSTFDESDVHQSASSGGVHYQAQSGSPSLSQAEMELLQSQLDGGADSLQTAVQTMRHHILSLSLDARGCLLVQRAIDRCEDRVAAELVSGLRGYIATVAVSKHGNFVVQKIIQAQPPWVGMFIVEELLDSASSFARHQCGCRIAARVLEHFPMTGVTLQFIDAIIAETYHLSRHGYAYHVVRAILEHGQPEQRQRVASILCSHIHRHAKHRYASFVVEQALRYSSEEVRSALARELMQRPGAAMDLAKHQFGRHVIEQLARVSEDASSIILSGLAELKRDKHGKRLLINLGLLDALPESKAGSGRTQKSIGNTIDREEDQDIFVQPVEEPTAEGMRHQYGATSAASSQDFVHVGGPPSTDACKGIETPKAKRQLHDSHGNNH